jgi:hypothetical protein
MIVPPGADEYYRSIEEEFNRRRGAPILLSPRDWALIGEWERDGVPLRLVLQGIANVFDAFERRGPTSRRINSLSYCRQEVMALHEIYIGLRGAEAGRPGSEGGDADRIRTVSRHLGRLLRRVRAAMPLCSEAGLDPMVAALARVAAELRLIRREAKKGTFDLAVLEETLKTLDDEIVRSARSALPPDEIRRLEEEADEALRERQGRMTPRALASTRSSLVARRLRQRCRLPRLTLFD